MKLWRFSLRYLSRNLWQTILLIVGIMLGVAVVVAIDFSNASAKIALDLSTQSLIGKSTHQIIAANGGLDEKLFVDLKNSGKLKISSPIVEGYISIPSWQNQAVHLLGVDPLLDYQMRDIYGQNTTVLPQLLSTFAKPMQAILSKGLAESHNLSIGQSLPIEFEGKNFILKIAGIIDSQDPLVRRSLEGLIIMDISSAQEILGQIGLLDRVDIRLVNDLEKTELEAVLPEGTYLVPSNQQNIQVNQMVSAFQINLTALSLLALVVGMFLIYNTMTFSVVHRRELIGYYRSFGFYRREIFMMIIFEALIIAILGTVSGVVLGILLGRQTIGLILQTINDLYFVTTVSEVGLPISSLIKGLILGIVATVAVSLPPAWEATRVTPHNASIRSGLEQKTSTSLNRLLILAVFLLIVAGILLAVPIFSSLWWAFAATFFIVVAFSLLTSVLLKFALPAVALVVKHYFGLIAGMAVRELQRSLSRTAIAISSLMVAISVTMGMTIMIESFRNTVDIWLKETLVGNIYLSVPNQFSNQSNAVIEPEVSSQILENPAIASWTSLSTIYQNTSAGEIQINVISNDKIAYERLFVSTVIPEEKIWTAMQNGSVLLSEPLARRLDLSAGDILELDSSKGPVSLSIAAVFYDYASNQGHLLIAKDFYESHWKAAGITALSLNVHDGIDVPTVVNDLIKLNQTQSQKLVIRDNKTLQRDALGVFDRTFRVTDALRFIATIISIIGIVSAVLLILYDRKREFGILKAIGLSSSELWRLILTETGLMGFFAGIFAIPTGYVVSLILVYIINLRSFGWTIQFQFGWIYILQTLLIAWVASLVAGIFPILAINKMEIIEVIRNE